MAAWQASIDAFSGTDKVPKKKRGRGEGTGQDVELEVPVISSDEPKRYDETEDDVEELDRRYR